MTGQSPTDELRVRARGLVPALRERAAEAERTRRPDDRSIAELEEAGLLSLLVPRAHGGHELGLEVLGDVVATLAEGCASTAWVGAFYMAHSWIGALFPEAGQRILFAERAWLRAPAPLAPNGVARREGAGFRLSGRWPWATGIAHADWVFAAGLIDGEESGRMFAVPANDVEVIDTWHTDGMRATASHDVAVHDVFVPECLTLDLDDFGNGTTPGAALHGSPLYRMPMVPFLGLVAALPALGAARHAVERFEARMRARVLSMTSARQSERAGSQMRLARAHLRVHSAELLLRDLAERLGAEAETGAPAPVERRAPLRMQAMWAVHGCREAIQGLSEVAGASAHFLDEPLQRALRDVNLLACHTLYDPDATAELDGRVRLGLDPETPLV